MLSPMEGRRLAFDKPVSSNTFSDVMNAPSLNTTDSPSEPVRVPSSELANLYAQVSYLVQRLINQDPSPQRQEQLLGMVGFFDRCVTEEIDTASAAGAPVPNMPQAPPPPPAAPPGAPGPGAAPQPAAPPMQGPGASAAPPPGGMPA